MFHLIVNLTTRTADLVATIQDAVERMRPMCLAEPGCVSWDAYQCTVDPRVFTLVEVWESEEAWEAHGELEAIQTVYLPQIVPHADRAVYPSRRLATGWDGPVVRPPR